MREYANIKIKTSSPQCLPTYGSAGASGADLRANIDHNTMIFPGKRKLIPTGVRIEMEAGYEAQVRGRSGLALKHGVTVLNSPGTIDSDYTGEIGVILLNTGEKPYTVEPLMRIAQLVVAPVSRIRWTSTDTLGVSERGEGGFGSTGVK